MEEVTRSENRGCEESGHRGRRAGGGGDEEDSDGTDFAHNSNNPNPDWLQLPTGIVQENVSNWRQVIDVATQPGERGSLHFSVAVDYSVSYSA